MNVVKKNFLLLILVTFLGLGLSACSGSGDELVIFTPEPDLFDTNGQDELDPNEHTHEEDAEGNIVFIEGNLELSDEALPTEIVELLDSNTVDVSKEVGEIPNPAAFRWAAVAQGFNAPRYITNAGDGSGRMFVVEQEGLVWELNRDFERREKPFMDIRDQVLVSYEQGLMSIAFSPDFVITGYVYAYYTNVNGNTIISRFTTDRLKTEVNEDLEEIVMIINQPSANHNGGQIEFGPDEFLYISVGDGGLAGDPGQNGQSLDSLLGKILRVNVDFGTDYVIPPDNPYFGLAGKEEIWVSGLHNPYRFSFDRFTGDIYIGDVGQTEWEEINFLPSDTLGGINFGWNYFEGTHIFGELAPDTPITDPILEYSRVENGCSVVGGYVYRGNAIHEWDGVYLYGDFCTGKIWGAVPQADGTWISEELFNLDIWIGSFGQDEFGEIYLVDYNNGDVYRLDRR